MAASADLPNLVVYVAQDCTSESFLSPVYLLSPLTATANAAVLRNRLSCTNREMHQCFMLI